MLCCDKGDFRCRSQRAVICENSPRYGVAPADGDSTQLFVGDRGHTGSEEELDEQEGTGEESIEESLVRGMEIEVPRSDASSTVTDFGRRQPKAPQQQRKLNTSFKWGVGVVQVSSARGLRYSDNPVVLFRMPSRTSPVPHLVSTDACVVYGHSG